MYVPDGDFKFTVGPGKMEEIVEKFGGPNAKQEWTDFMKALQPIVKISIAMSPLALRTDFGAAFTVGRYLPSLIKAGFTPAVTGDILSVAEKVNNNTVWWGFWVNERDIGGTHGKRRCVICAASRL